jgi:hypothetical protein
MDKSRNPPAHLGSCRYLTLYRGVLDSSIIQGPFSVAPCQTLISRFATFFIAVECLDAVEEDARHAVVQRDQLTAFVFRTVT